MTQSIDSANPPLSPPTPVGGWHLVTTVATGAVVSAVIGTATYYSAHWWLPSANAALATQIIVAEVYSTLIIAFALSFDPLPHPSLDVRLCGYLCRMIWSYVFRAFGKYAMRRVVRQARTIFMA
jgi:hypothetical protein